ncbi:hypothetical protein RUND412_003869 [Rhizina undulata]
MSKSPSNISSTHGDIATEPTCGEGSWSKIKTPPASITYSRHPSVSSGAVIEMNSEDGSFQGAAASPVTFCGDNGFYIGVEAEIPPELVSARHEKERKLINKVPTEKDPSEYLIAGSDHLLKIFDADFGILPIKDEIKVLGTWEHSQEALALLDHLRMKDMTSVLASQDLSKDFPDIMYPPGSSVISGFLLAPLCNSECDFIVFFRNVQKECVHWDGKPYETTLEDGKDGYPEPRNSFKTCKETVVGKRREWTQEQMETASVLCLVYGNFFELWRQKDAALRSRQSTRTILANASHAARVPLNAIINYLEIALESTLISANLENVSRCHSASISLISFINYLLDLTRTEEGNALVNEEAFDLINTINDAISSFKFDVDRKGLSLDVTEGPRIPKFVIGDKAGICQAIKNILENAIQHTSHGGVKVELWASQLQLDWFEFGISVQDTGVALSTQELDILFRELEEVSTEGDAKGIEKGGTFDDFSKIPGQKILGLGLAVVARILANMNGHLRIKSEMGKGSQFTINVPFSIPRQQDTGNDVFHLKDDSSLFSTQFPIITPPNEETVNETLEINKTSGSQGRMPVESERKIIVGRTKNLLSRDSGINEIERIVDAYSVTHLGNSALSKKSTCSFTSLSPLPPALKIPSSAVHLSGNNSLPLQTPPGQQMIQGCSVPLTSAGIPAATAPPSLAEPILLQNQSGQNNMEVQQEFMVLVAEDNKVNSKIFQKMMGKLGHKCDMTANGQQCAIVFAKNRGLYDAVFMDMRMPIMDGETSTSLIRQHEKLNAAEGLPEKHIFNGRIPIFAFGTRHCLFEERREEYIRMGFDGWLMKPMRLKMLETLMASIVDPSVRRHVTYVPGKWGASGWFAADGESDRIFRTFAKSKL